MKRKIRRSACFSGIKLLYTLTLWEGEREPMISLRARGAVKQRRARIKDFPHGRAAAIGFFRKIVKGRVTPLGLADVYEDFLQDMEYKSANCKENFL